MELPRLEDIEFTLEDILNIHRYWVTKLYIEERKTIEQIVEELLERGLKATPLQVRTCIRNWRLALPDNSSEIALSPTRSQGSSTITENPTTETKALRSRNTSPSIVSYAPSDADVAVIYTHKPPPPLPYVNHNDSKVRKQRASTTDRLRLTCHHGLETKDVHKVYTRLDSIPRTEMGRRVKMTTLEMYAAIQQSHEMIAVSIQRTPDTEIPHRRAGDRVTDERNRSLPRKRNRMTVIKRKPKVLKVEKEKGLGNGKEIERTLEDEGMDEGIDDDMSDGTRLL